MEPMGHRVRDYYGTAIGYLVMPCHRHGTAIWDCHESVMGYDCCHATCDCHGNPVVIAMKLP